MAPEYQELEEESITDLGQEPYVLRWPDFATVLMILLTIFFISQRMAGPAWTAVYLTFVVHVWALPGIWLNGFFRASFLFPFNLGVYFMYQYKPSKFTLAIIILAALWSGVITTRNYYISLRYPLYKAR